MNSKQQDLRQKTIVHLFLSQKARRRYLQAEPALCGNSIFGTTSDQAQPGSLWLEGFQVLPLQVPTVMYVVFSLLTGASTLLLLLLLLLLPSRQMYCLEPSLHTTCLSLIKMQDAQQSKSHYSLCLCVSYMFFCLCVSHEDVGTASRLAQMCVYMYMHLQCR